MEALKLQQSIGYIFKNQAYLHEALTHSSHGNSEKNNERLEYLGDAIEAHVIAWEEAPENEDEDAL